MEQKYDMTAFIKEGIASGLEYLMEEATVITPSETEIMSGLGGSIKSTTAEERQADVDACLKEYDTPKWRQIPLDELDIYLSNTNGRKPKVIVDAGSGPGITSEVLIQKLSPTQLILVDTSPEMLAAAKTRLGGYSCEVQYINGDVKQIDECVNGVLKGAADLVFMHSVMHYISPLAYEGMFSRIRNLLSSNGAFVFDVPFQSDGTVEAMVLQAFAVVLHERYNIPELEQIIAAPIRGTWYQDFAKSKLDSAGFASESYDFRVKPDDERVRAYAEESIERLASALSEMLEVKRKGPNMIKDIDELLTGKTQIVSEVCQRLSKLYYGLVTLYIARPLT